MREIRDLKLRYGRQTMVPEIGKGGQEKLCDSKVLIIGCGALGSMIAMQLAGAGIGVLGIADYDKVDISNLQRQFFFTTDELGLPKVDLLFKRIISLNPDVEVISYRSFISPAKAEEIFEDYDFIVDATDNPESKKMIGDIALKKRKACCIGGVRNFSGQIMTLLPSDLRFENYFGQSNAEGLLPCSLGGVMGPAAALCASVQASETIKYLTDAGTVLSGRLLVFNLLENSFHTFRI